MRLTVGEGNGTIPLMLVAEQRRRDIGMGAKSGSGASRRACLKIIAAAAGGVAAGVGGAKLVGRMGRAPEGPWRVLTPDEARLVEAVSEQIIPADRDPGAKEAGVVHFIDRQLDGPYKRFAEKYHAGLACLAKTCLAMFGKPFEELPWPDQTRVLQALEASKAPKAIWTKPSSSEFFNLIRDHSMQGFYGSPRHGGNRHYASYKMLGLEYPRVIGQNRYPGT
jgi:gluconate 2-dehydrogenase gamma chain